ncbi:DUF4915 domain-containing protein [Agrobacterium vitis]
MSELFDNLFISCPNGGGLFFIKGSNVYCLDNQETTGIFIDDHLILRAAQPNDLHVYTQRPKIIAGKQAGFADVHDVLIHDGACYIVGTEQNEVVKLSPDGEELQRWKYPGEPDSWHINCLTVWKGRIVFSAFGNFREHRQYKGNTSKSGFVQDLLTGEVLVKNLSQPHSVIARGTSLIVANSEEMEVLEFNEKGTLLRSRALDGYTRGIAVLDDVIYVGISRSRNIESDQVQGAMIVALDASSFDEIGRIEVPANEIYTVACRPDDQRTIKSLATICQNSAIMFAEKFQHVSTDIAALQETLEQRSVEIANLNQCKIDRESEISALRLELSARDEHIATLDQNRANQEGEISALNQAVNELKQSAAARDDEMRVLRERLSDGDKEVADLKKQIAERDDKISALDAALEERNQKIAGIEQQIAERDDTISALDAALEECNQKIAGIEQQIAERDDTISALSATVGKHKEEIATLRQKTADINNEISELDQTVLGRDEEIAVLKKNTYYKDSEISTLNDTLADQQKEIDRLRYVISHTYEELNNQREELAALKSSLSWKLMKPFRYL